MGMYVCMWVCSHEGGCMCMRVWLCAWVVVRIYVNGYV